MTIRSSACHVGVSPPQISDPGKAQMPIQKKTRDRVSCLAAM